MGSTHADVQAGLQTPHACAPGVRLTLSRIGKANQMSTGRTSTHADRSPLYAGSKKPLFLFLRSRTPDDGCTEQSEAFA
jgi:hypothetical protein